MNVFTQTIAGVLLANFITAWFVYGMWRIKKNERDLPGLFIVLVCLGFGGLIWASLPA